MASDNAWKDILEKLEDEDKHLQAAVKQTEALVDCKPKRPITSRPADEVPLNVIAREIKTMPYGDTMELAKVCLDEKDASSVAIDVVAHNLWTWALKRHLT